MMFWVRFEFGFSSVRAYFTLQILTLDPVVLDFQRLLPVDLRSQKRGLNVDDSFLAGSLCVPGVTRQTASKF